MNKKLIFITGTRADFGKLKSILELVAKSNNFDLTLFTTGMHMLVKYGYTYEEVKYNFPESVYGFVNQNHANNLEEILAKTITGLSDLIHEKNPDLIVVHGDRIEALAGAIVGSLNHILVAHIEGGEVSGTIDDSIRHVISKFSHLHFVSNEASKKRLSDMGENKKSIFVIGSPEFDAMTSALPPLSLVLNHYEIPFTEFAIVLFHPVTSELQYLKRNTNELVSALMESGSNYLVIQPNNDPGSEVILDSYSKILGTKNVKFFESIRFEFFLTLLKESKFIIGNSSAGIREAPFFGTPTLNLGSRQNGRSNNTNIINLGFFKKQILENIKKVEGIRFDPINEFGNDRLMKSCQQFIEIINRDSFWNTGVQKVYVENRINI